MSKARDQESKLAQELRKEKSKRQQLEKRVTGLEKALDQYTAPAFGRTRDLYCLREGVTSDITVGAEQSLRYRLYFKEIITYLATSFINIETSRIDAGINDALRAIGEFMRVDRSYIFLASNDGRTLINTHEWCAEGVEPQMNTLQGLQASMFPWWMSRLRRLEVISISNVSDMPSEAATEKELLQGQDILSVLAFPLGQPGAFLGFFGLDSVRCCKEWSDIEVSLLQVAAEVVANLLKRKKAEEALSESEKRYRLLADNATDMIWTTDLEGRLTYVSPSVVELLAYTVEEVLQHNILHDDNPELRAAAAGTIALLQQGTGPVPELPAESTLEFEAVRKDGDHVWFEMMLKPLLNAEGLPIGLLGSGRDITERRRARRALEESYTLEKDLRKRLEDEAAGRVEFLRVLVHELKTPLTSVMASGELLMMELPEGPLLAAARNLYRSADNLHRRIDELLDLARGEVGMLRLNLHVVDPADLLEEVYDEMLPMIRSRGHEIKLDLPPCLPKIVADGTRVHQVVMNLLDNASKFISRPGMIMLSIRNREDGLTIIVEDTGPGLSYEEQARLFNPYQRIAGDREHLSGLGLGLALCKRIIELHGGCISVKSDRSAGSVFSFSIPLTPRDGETAMEAD